MKSGNIADGNAGTTTTAQSSIQMQTGNNAGNTGTECKGLSQFDPTGSCASDKLMCIIHF